MIAVSHPLICHICACAISASLLQLRKCEVYRFGCSNGNYEGHGLQVLALCAVKAKAACPYYVHVQYLCSVYAKDVHTQS